VGVPGPDDSAGILAPWETFEYWPVAGGISLKVLKNPRSSAQVRRHKTLANEYQIIVESPSFLSFGTTTWL
jgi:hypothetical protein